MVSILSLCLGSCRTQRQTSYVPLEFKSISTETDSLTHLLSKLIQRSMSQKEATTVYVKETATYTVNETGDTTKTVIERERDSSREWEGKETYYQSVIDSLSRQHHRADTIDRPVPYPVTEIRKVNVLKWWQKTLMWSGAAAWAGIAFVGIWKIKK